MPPDHGCPSPGPPSPEVTEAICRVPSAQFAQRLGILYQSTCVGFGYGLMQGLFPGTLRPHPQSDKGIRSFTSVTTCWLRNIHLIPIDYAFRPRLRDRLTLRRLALRRNPWTFGEGDSHTLSVTHVSILTSDTSRGPHRSSFTGLRNAPLPRVQVHTHSFGARLEPRYIVRAGTLV